MTVSAEQLFTEHKENSGNRDIVLPGDAENIQTKHASIIEVFEQIETKRRLVLRNSCNFPGI